MKNPYSLLRYSGSKYKLHKIFERICKKNDFETIFEVFCGSASITLYLLSNNLVKQAYLNDRDKVIYWFWNMIFHYTDHFLKELERVKIDYDTWLYYKNIVDNANRLIFPDYFKIGFAGFYLNRTNYNGIISKASTSLRTGSLSTVRFNKERMYKLIRKIADENREKIVDIWNSDGIDIINLYIRMFDREKVSKTLFFLDPPYVYKSDKLYNYKFSDHETLATYIQNLNIPYIITYDDVAEIKELYRYSNIDYFTNSNGIRELIIYGNLEY